MRKGRKEVTVMERKKLRDVLSWKRRKRAVTVTKGINKEMD
jgi:hypothetical protein